MAEANLSFLEEDMTCVICCDIYTDPVTLKCSHSLCKKCLQKFWTTQDVARCPVCRKECTHDEPTKSLAFKALCESYKNRNPTAVPEDICQEHKEKLKLFCFEDKQPICVVCYTSKRHENHKCSPVEEAVEALKDDLEERIYSLQVTLTEFIDAHDSCLKEAELIKKQTMDAENQIKEEFKKLHQFLNEEEEKWIRNLPKEVKSQNMIIKARMEKLSTQISDLSEKTAAVWQDMEAENITFLQNYAENLQRLKCPSVQSIVPELEKNEHHPHQTLIFTTWARMQELVEKSPVTLDPNTASKRLLVSQDCCSVQYVEDQLSVSDNPKRLYVGVLAAQGFSSGVHCWDVEVGDNGHWTLGVVGATVNRTKLFKMDPNSRFWCLRHKGGKYQQCGKNVMAIDKNEKPYIIRVKLDFDLGELRFTDPFRNRSLCTFTGGFPEMVFPYFCTGELGRPLRIYMGNNTC